jgi:hypothetical protein
VINTSHSISFFGTNHEKARNLTESDYGLS